MVQLFISSYVLVLIFVVMVLLLLCRGLSNFAWDSSGQDRPDTLGLRDTLVLEHVSVQSYDWNNRVEAS